MTEAARTSEANVATLIATLTKMQEDHVRFGNELQNIGRTVAIAVATTHVAASPPPLVGESGTTVDVEASTDSARRLADCDDGMVPPTHGQRVRQAHATAGGDDSIPALVRTRFETVPATGDHNRHPLFPDVDPSTLHHVHADVMDDDRLPAPKPHTPGTMSLPSSRADGGSYPAHTVPHMDTGRSPFRFATMPKNHTPRSPLRRLAHRLMSQHEMCGRARVVLVGVWW